MILSIATSPRARLYSSLNSSFLFVGEKETRVSGGRREITKAGTSPFNFHYTPDTIGCVCAPRCCYYVINNFVTRLMTFCVIKKRFVRQFFINSDTQWRRLKSLVCAPPYRASCHYGRFRFTLRAPFNSGGGERESRSVCE